MHCDVTFERWPLRVVNTVARIAHFFQRELLRGFRIHAEDEIDRYGRGAGHTRCLVALIPAKSNQLQICGANAYRDLFPFNLIDL